GSNGGGAAGGSAGAGLGAGPPSISAVTGDMSKNVGGSTGSRPGWRLRGPFLAASAVCTGCGAANGFSTRGRSTAGGTGIASRSAGDGGGGGGGKSSKS